MRIVCNTPHANGNLLVALEGDHTLHYVFTDIEGEWAGSIAVDPSVSVPDNVQNVLDEIKQMKLLFAQEQKDDYLNRGYALS